MGYFTKYRKHYAIPERFTSDEARSRRLAATLAREQTLSRDLAAARELSRVKERTKFVPLWKVDNDQKSGHKAASIAAALATFQERDFANPEKRKLYRALRAQQEGLRKVKAAASDRRQYHPEKGYVGSTVYGSPAKIGGSAHRLTATSWLPMFLHPASVIPCIDRMVRKEVMFALGKGGRGYHTRKRRTDSSGVPC